MLNDSQPEEEIQDIPLDLLPFPLHEAAYKGDNHRMAALLASADHDIDQPIGQYGTPLQVASLSGHASVVRCLLDSSADVNVHAGRYGTALQAAAAEGHSDIARALLDAGAVVNKRAGMYRNALQAATSNGHDSVFNLLLDCGARTDGVYLPDGKPIRRSRDLASDRPGSVANALTRTGDAFTLIERKFSLDQPMAATTSIDEETKERLKPPATSAPKADEPLTDDELLTDADDDGGEILYHCKGCGEILEECVAVELAGNRWHIDCFRCYTCDDLLNLDADLLSLREGNIICNNCRYSSSACHEKIEEGILKGDQAFSAKCFRCRNCKKKIENLRYARTSQGIFCMPCHEGLMSRTRKKIREASHNSRLEPYSLDKSLPALPPRSVQFPESLSSDASSSYPISTSPEPKIGESSSPKTLRVPRKQVLVNHPSPLGTDPSERALGVPDIMDSPSRPVSITHPSSSMPRPQSGSIASMESPEGGHNEAALQLKQFPDLTIHPHTLSGPPNSADRYPVLFPEPETPEKRKRFSARDLLLGRGNRSRR